MRVRPRWVAGSLITASLLVPAGLGAQAASVGASPAASTIQPATFWWDASLGAGSSQVSCGICANGVDTGPFLTLAWGAYASTTIGLGIELGGWTHRDGDVRERILQGSLSVRFARDPRAGLHYLAGAGWMQYRAGDFAYAAPQLQLGLGWSLPVTAVWGVGGRLLTDIAPFGSLENGGRTVADGVRVGTLRLAVFVRRN